MEELFELDKYVKFQELDGEGCIFISYQKSSFDDLKRISDYLEMNSIKTWYAPRNIKLGDEWPEKLVEAISKCKAVLLLYTKEADCSKHVLREIHIADSEKKPIVWLKLDETSPSGTLKYYVSLIQAFSFRKEKEALKKLTDILSLPDISKEYLSTCKQIESTSIDDMEVQQWAKGIYAFQTSGEAGECVARTYFLQARKKPYSTVLLPTGRSAKEIFYGMIRVSNEYEGCPFGEAFLMNDTETFGVNSRHVTSRIKTINDYLISPLRSMGKGPNEDKLTYFSGISNDDEEPEEMAKKQIEKHPISISGVSISPYGEIIGYDFGQYTADIVNDGPRSIEINNDSKKYIDERQKTNTIYSVGLNALLESDILLILAFDREKASAIKTLFKGDINPNMPVTLLKRHKNAYVILTKDVAEVAGLLNHCTSDLSPKEVSKCIIRQ